MADQNPTGANQDAETQAAKTTEEKELKSPAADESDAGEAKQKTFTQEELNRIVKRESDKAAKKAADDAKLSADELKDKQLAELTKKTQLLEAKELVADKLSADSPNAAKLFLAIYQSKIEFDKSGTPSNLDDLIKEAREEYPEIFAAEAAKPKPPKIEAGAKGAGPAGDVNSNIRRGFGRK